MTNKASKDNKYEKLRESKNWPQRSNFMKAILKEKEVWDIVDDTTPEAVIVAQIKKKEKAM